MKSIRFCVMMGISTCMGLLVCLAGCPSKPVQPDKPVNTTPPHVIAKADLDRLYFEYERRLHPEPGRGGVSPGRELVLVNFKEGPVEAHKHLEDLKKDVESIIMAKGKITKVDHFDNWEYVIRYEHKNVLRGTAKIRFIPHREFRDHWNLELKVEEQLIKF